MIITEQEGNVVLENLNSTGDVILEKIKGSLTLRDVINSDMVITAQEGNVALSNLKHNRCRYRGSGRGSVIGREQFSR